MIDQITKTIFSNTVYQVSGKVLTSLLGFISVALIARHLGVLGFGQYSLVYSFLGIFGIFSDFGLATLLIREVAANKADSKLISGIFSLRVILSVLVILLAFLVLSFFPYQELVKKGIVFALLGQLFLGLSSIYWAIEQGRLNFLKVVAIQALVSLSSTILVILGTKIAAGLIYFVGAGVVGAFLGLGISFWLGTKKIILFSPAVYKRILVKVWPIGLWAAVSTIYLKQDLVILSLFYSPDKFPEVGYYSAAFKYFEVASVMLGFYQMTSYPVIAAHLKKKSFALVFKKIVRYSWLIAFSGVILLFFLVQPLILVLGSNFLPAVPALRVLSLALGVSVLAGPWVSLAIAAEKQKLVLANSLVAFSINLLGNLIIIPRASFLGASLVMVLTQSWVTYSCWRISRKVLVNPK